MVKSSIKLYTGGFMANNNYSDDEIIAALITAGVLVVFGYGTYRIIKSIGSYKSGTIVSYNEVVKLEQNYSSPNQQTTSVEEELCYPHGNPITNSYYGWCPDCEADDYFWDD